MNSTLEFTSNSEFVEIETKGHMDEELKFIFQQYGTLTQRWIIPNTYFGTFQAQVLEKFPEFQFQIKSGQNYFRTLPLQQRSRGGIFNFGLSKKKGFVVLRTELEIDEDILQTHEVIQKNGNAGPRKLIPFHFYSSCVKELQTKYPDVDFIEDETLSEYLNDFQLMETPKAKSITCVLIKKELDTKLLHHQRECIRKGVELNGRMLIADDAGLGKTLSSLALAEIYSHSWPLLIICPSILRKHWQDEIKKWFDYSDNVQIIENSETTVSKKKIIIISYKLCGALKEELLEKKFKICIVDETQNLRNKTKHFGACEAIFNQAKQIFFLSGTPIMSATYELYSQLKFINQQKLDGLYVFSDPNQVGNTDLDFNNSESIYEYLRKYYLQRTTRRQIQDKLSRLTRYLVQIPIEHYDPQNYPNQKKRYKQQGLAKLQGILLVLEKFLQRDGKIVFFAFHKEILEAVKQKCHQLNQEAIVISGKISEELRKSQIDKFQNKNSQIKIAILSYKCASIGISLTAASTVIFGELYYEIQSTMIQAEARVHRLTQMKNVNCFYLIGNTEEELSQFKKMKQRYVGLTQDLNQTEEEFEIFFLPIQSLDRPQYLIMRQHLQKVENDFVQQRNRGEAIQDKLEKEFKEFKGRITRSRSQILNQQLPEQSKKIKKAKKESSKKSSLDDYYYKKNK